MKIVIKALLGVVAFAALTLFVCLCWFYFYSGDLPRFASLAQFAPDSTATAFDECSSSPVQVISSSSVGRNLQNAVRAAEGESDTIFALQISRSMFCNSRITMLKRHLLEYKAAVQLRRRFTPEQLLTIYLNRAYFGNSLIGAESASLHYCGKHASELDVGQAALIAGLIKGPSFYSPELHPERAKVRRNTVIQAMLKNGTVTAEQAEAAEQSALR